jgi:hypothetical protein
LPLKLPSRPFILNLFLVKSRFFFIFLIVVILVSKRIFLLPFNKPINLGYILLKSGF